LGLVVSAGIAACGGNARTHHQPERVAAGDEESRKEATGRDVLDKSALYTHRLA